MEDVFAGAEFGVECDGRRIDVVGLDIDDVGTALAGDFLELDDQRCGDALAAVGFVDGEIVDVDFAALLFELDEFVGGESADDLAGFQRSEGDEGVACEEFLVIRGARA